MLGLVTYACLGKFIDILSGLLMMSTGGLLTVENTRTQGLAPHLTWHYLIWAGAELTSWNVLFGPHVVLFLGALLSEAELEYRVTVY